MAIKMGAYLSSKDVYIDYPFEEVMFRRAKNGGGIYRKFYGQQEALEQVPHDNKLYNDALLSGNEISREEYLIGKNI